MALTRKFLKAMGIDEEKVEQIVEAHSETVNGLKDQLAGLRADAEKLPDVQKELDALKAAGDGGFEEKYQAEHRAFEEYKSQVSAKERKTAQEAAAISSLKTSPARPWKSPCGEAQGKYRHWNWRTGRSRTPLLWTPS